MGLFDPRGWGVTLGAALVLTGPRVASIFPARRSPVVLSQPHPVPMPHHPASASPSASGHPALFASERPFLPRVNPTRPWGEWLQQTAGTAIALLCAAGMLTGCAARLRLAAGRPLIEDILAATSRQADVTLAVQAAPAYLLALEGLLAGTPRDHQLLVTAARAYTAYGTLIEMDEPTRARALYRRGRDCGLAALSHRDPAIDLTAVTYGAFAAWQKRLRPADLPAVFWTAAAWGSWIALSTDSLAAVAEVPKVVLLMEWVVARDPEYEHGAPHLLLGVYHASLPPALGGNPTLALTHFDRAIELSQGHHLLTYVLKARYYARQVFDRELYVSLLQRALSLPVDAVPELTLQNAAAQRQARVLLEETDAFF